MDDPLKPGNPNKDLFPNLFSCLRAPEEDTCSVEVRPPVSAGQQSHLHRTHTMFRPVVKSADLLGLAEPHLPPRDNQPVKQGEKSDASSSNPPACVVMRPSHPSISTSLKTGAPEIGKRVSSLPSTSQAAESVLQPIGRQETAQDHARRINQEISSNEKKLSDMGAIGYVPPHLRPAPRASVCDTEDAYGNYIPPHLRRPRGADGRVLVSNPANIGWGGSGGEPTAIKPHKVSVVLTPISRIAEKQTADVASFIEVAKPTTMAIPPRRHISTPAQVKGSMGSQQSATIVPHPLPAQDTLRSESTTANRPEPPRRRAASPPPPPPVGGTKIRTAYFPLRPETPPLPPSQCSDEVPPYNYRRGGSSYARNDIYSSCDPQDSRSSYYRDDGGGGGRGGRPLILDHEKARKMRSYTRYRAKPGFAPHNPRLPFEFLHKIYGQTGATYAETLGERLESSSVIGPRSLPVPGKTYSRPSTPQGHITPDNLERGYRVPKHDHTGGHHSAVALGSSSETPIVETDLIFKAWPQPPNRTGNERQPKSRSVILSGFTETVSLEHVSRVCKATGKVEDMEISNKRGMAMVTFVKASTAKHFYETTDARGILLVYLDEETNETMRARIYIDMNPEAVAIEDSLRQAIETEGASRVLEVTGWDRDILEEIVGGPHEGGVGYSDLLMRLASLYCPSQRVQCVDWRQDGDGQMEVRFVYAGIKEAVEAHVGLGKEHALEGCQIAFGSDP